MDHSIDEGHWYGHLKNAIEETRWDREKKRKGTDCLGFVKGIFVTLYHCKSPSNHHLRDFVLLVPSILSKSKFWDVGMVTVSIKSIDAGFCPITPFALCWNYVICKRLYHVIHHHHQKTVGGKICVNLLFAFSQPKQTNKQTKSEWKATKKKTRKDPCVVNWLGCCGSADATSTLRWGGWEKYPGGDGGVNHQDTKNGPNLPKEWTCKNLMPSLKGFVVFYGWGGKVNLWHTFGRNMFLRYCCVVGKKMWLEAGSLQQKNTRHQFIGWVAFQLGELLWRKSDTKKCKKKKHVEKQMVERSILIHLFFVTCLIVQLFILYLDMFKCGMYVLCIYLHLCLFCFTSIWAPL